MKEGGETEWGKSLESRGNYTFLYRAFLIRPENFFQTQGEIGIIPNPPRGLLQWYLESTADSSSTAQGGQGKSGSIYLQRKEMNSSRTELTQLQIYQITLYHSSTNTKCHPEWPSVQPNSLGSILYPTESLKGKLKLTAGRFDSLY